MKRNIILSIQDFLRKRSKRPWACFETDGFSKEGLGIRMYWNKAFIKGLHEHGIQATSDQETVQMMFLYISSQVTGFTVGGAEIVNPEATPQLTNEANTFIK